MVKDVTYIVMETFILVIINMASLMDMDNISGLMDLYIQVSSEMEKSMVKVIGKDLKIRILIVTNMKVTMKMI
jgi:hypothetical protein